VIILEQRSLIQPKHVVFTHCASKPFACPCNHLLIISEQIQMFTFECLNCGTVFHPELGYLKANT